MTLAAAREERTPFRVVGLLLPQWLFALRVWLAILIALAMAFWLQLESASTAAVTIGILAQPRRGQAFRKAAYFFAATVIGVLFAFLITAIFSQSRDLFLVAFAAWLAMTVYVAAFYDGPRSYGAVLSGYTVAIISVTHIDSPQDVFADGVSRLAAISIGIAAIVLVNDVLASPTVYPSVRDKLHAAHQRVGTLVAALVWGETVAPGPIVALLGSITGTRLDILAAASEGPNGREQSAAAASAATAMIETLAKARGFATLMQDAPPQEAAVLRGWVATKDQTAAEGALHAAMALPDHNASHVARLVVVRSLIARQRLAGDELAAMEAGRAPRRHVGLPIHRDREVARLASLRVFLAVTVSSIILIVGGWPQTSDCLLFVAVLCALSSTMPNPRFFAKSALVALPLAAIAAGIVEYIILDGADAFALLAIALAPVAILSCALMQRPPTASIGGLLLTFTLVVLSPSNPPSYNAESYITSTTLIISAALLFGALFFACFPITDKDRRRWMVNRARTDLLEAMAGRPRHAPADMAYLTADRIVALARFEVGFEAAKRWRLAYTLLLFALTDAVGQGQRRLDKLPRDAIPDDVEGAARDAFASLHVVGLQEAADALFATRGQTPIDQRCRIAGVVADLHIAAGITKRHASELRHLRRVVAA